MNIQIFPARLLSMGLALLTVLISPKPSAGFASGADKIIAVMGSSLAAGWVTSRESKQDMQNGYVFRLARLLTPRGFKVVNISVPGDTTQKLLNRMEKDLFPLKPDFAIIALSLENEGIRGLEGKDPAKVYTSFKENLRKIIDQCRARGIQPILGSCYANDNFIEPAHYQAITEMNLEINSWDVPSINLLGALDRNDGRFVEGLPTFDLDHPEDLGHRELFYSIVPSLFEAATGKPLTRKDSGEGSVKIGKTGSPAPLSFVPEDPFHSFSVVFKIRGGSRGIAAAIRGLDGKTGRLWMAEDGSLEYHSSEGAVHPVRISLDRKTWHHVGIGHHFLKKETRIFIDGTFIIGIPETITPAQFILGGPGETLAAGPSCEAEYRDWMIFRAPLNAAEMSALHKGRLLQASLEIDAPLDGVKMEKDQRVENLARSLGRVVALSSQSDRDISRLRAAVRRIESEERIFIDPNAKKPVQLASEVLDVCTGLFEFENPPGLTVTVVREGVRLFLLLNGGSEGKMELFPLSPDRFFVKVVGAEIEISFVSENKGERPGLLLFNVDGREMRGKRK